MQRKFYVVFLVYIFGLILNQAIALDQRIAIKISEKHKSEILAEMRKNMETIHGIITALAKEDFDHVEQLASALGRMDHSDEIMQRRQLMPEGFRALGPQMHLGFQDIARDARDFGDVQHSLEQVSTVMNKCIACHSTYRLEVSN